MMMNIRGLTFDDPYKSESRLQDFGGGLEFCVVAGAEDGSIWD